MHGVPYPGRRSGSRSYFTPWILEVIDPLAALVTRRRRQVKMFSRRRLRVRAVSIVGRSRLRPAHPCHPRKCFLAGRS
jgi:hypothetical protein